MAILLILLGGLVFAAGVVFVLLGIVPALHGDWYGSHGSVATFVMYGLLIIALGYAAVRLGRRLEAKAGHKRDG